DHFGNSVALSGDIAVIGAYFNTINGDEWRGAAYVFAHTGALWVQQQKLFAEDGWFDDYFGNSVAFNGNTVVVGAWGSKYDTPTGAAYVFTIGDGLAQQPRLVASDGLANDSFGHAVALDGNRALVGAYADDYGVNQDQGSAYVFVRNGTTW